MLSVLIVKCVNVQAVAENKDEFDHIFSLQSLLFVQFTISN